MGKIEVDSIFRFLDGYSWGDVKEAFEKLKQDVEEGHTVHRDAVMRDFEESGWVVHEGDPPKGFEWQIVSGQLYVRDPKKSKDDSAYKQVKMNDPVGKKVKKRTDTGIRPVDSLKCPECGNGGLFKEGICPACDDGKKGFKIRLLCGECDFTKLL